MRHKDVKSTLPMAKVLQCTDEDAENTDVVKKSFLLCGIAPLGKLVSFECNRHRGILDSSGDLHCNEPRGITVLG